MVVVMAAMMADVVIMMLMTVLTMLTMMIAVSVDRDGEAVVHNDNEQNDDHMINGNQENC